MGQTFCIAVSTTLRFTNLKALDKSTFSNKCIAHGVQYIGDCNGLLLLLFIVTVITIATISTRMKNHTQLSVKKSIYACFNMLIQPFDFHAVSIFIIFSFL